VEVLEPSCITIIDTVIQNKHTNDAYYYVRWIVEELEPSKRNFDHWDQNDDWN
jgi:hypothetical protein